MWIFNGASADTWKERNDPLSPLVPSRLWRFTAFDHFTMVGYSLQLLLIYRSAAHCLFSSEAYMTNHTSHFKQLELSLAINHHDACYCAHNRAAFRWEEGRGALWAIQYRWSTDYCERNSGVSTDCCSMCRFVHDLNTNQGEKQPGVLVPLCKSPASTFFNCSFSSKLFLSLFLKKKKKKNSNHGLNKIHKVQLSAL